MAMSDDPRYRRGQSGNQRSLQGQDEMRGRGESRNERPARNYSGADTSGERPSAAGARTPSFSAYRPEAYAGSDSRPPRQDWEEPRAAPQRAPSPVESYPRAAPERPSAQQNTRDTYQDTRDFYRGGAADPYATPGHEQEWRPSSYQDSKPSYPESKPSYPESKSYYPESNSFQTPPSYPETPTYPEKASFDKASYADVPAYQDSKYPAFYDETPPEPDVQDTHNHFFAEPEAPQQRFRGGDYGNSFDDPREIPAYAPPAPPAQQRGNFGTERGGYAPGWEDHAPAPASLRPYQAPAVQPHAREDEVDDYFADEDEFENEDFPEEKKSGRTKLIAAVLVGAIVTGGSLAYLYKYSNRGGEAGVPLVEANADSFKETPPDPGGRKFPTTKPIQARLVEADTDTNSSSETAGAVTTTSSGSLEERINKALQDAKGNDEGAASEANASPDTPQSVRTVSVNPDGSFGGNPAHARHTATATPEVATTAANSETDTDTSSAPVTRSISETRLASATPASHNAVQEIPEAPGGTGQFFVQIGARNDQAQALAAFNTVQQKYSSILGNHSPSIRKADLGERGIWYRLRVGPFNDKPSADTVCEELKTAGWKQCFSVKD